MTSRPFLKCHKVYNCFDLTNNVEGAPYVCFVNLTTGNLPSGDNLLCQY